ncbi:MAG: hypothetical protein U1E62_21460 [Alsobacter sp.]
MAAFASIFSNVLRDPVMTLVTSGVNSARKEEAELRLRFFHDRQADDLIAAIASRWSDPAAFRPVFVNLVRKVVTKRATSYLGAPVRTFEGADPDAMKALYADMGVDVLMKKASRYCKLLKTVAIRVGWDEEMARPCLHVVTPNILDVEFTDPERPTRFVLTNRGQTDADTTYSDWTATTFRMLTRGGSQLPNPGNPKGVNPYGLLPFVPVFDYAPDDRFFLFGGDDLMVAQRALNVLLANLWRTLELQAFGQPWAAGLPAGDVLRAGPDRVLTLPTDGKFGFAAPETPVDGILASAEFLLKQTALANDLPGNTFETDPKAESGAAKTVAERDLIEARADEIELFRRVEQRLFEVIKVVTNTHAPGTIPESARLASIDFAELDRGETDADRLASYQSRIDIGIWSEVDAFLADNPDVRDRADALKILQARQEERSALGAAFAGPSFTPAPAPAAAPLDPSPGASA